MAWDFSTDPEFEKTLSWIRTFVEDEVLPIETISPQLSQEQLDTITRPLKEEVKARGLWACHLGPELGGPGMGQVKLGLMHEILGRTLHAPEVFGNQAPDSGNAELLAVGANESQKEKWLWPLVAGVTCLSRPRTFPLSSFLSNASRRRERYCRRIGKRSSSRSGCKGSAWSGCRRKMWRPKMRAARITGLSR